MESENVSRMCVVSIVVPYTDNTSLLSVKTELDKVFALLPKVKIEYRFVEVKDDAPPGQ